MSFINLIFTILCRYNLVAFYPNLWLCIAWKAVMASAHPTAVLIAFTPISFMAILIAFTPISFMTILISFNFVFASVFLNSLLLTYSYPFIRLFFILAILLNSLSVYLSFLLVLLLVYTILQSFQQVFTQFSQLFSKQEQVFTQFSKPLSKLVFTQFSKPLSKLVDRLFSKQGVKWFSTPDAIRFFIQFFIWAIRASSNPLQLDLFASQLLSGLIEKHGFFKAFVLVLGTCSNFADFGFD